MRFLSPHKNLMLMGGPRGAVRFVEGTYEAADKEEVAWLKRHSGFNLDFFPESQAPMKPPPSNDSFEAQIRLLEAEKGTLERNLLKLTRELADVRSALTRAEAQLDSRKDLVKDYEVRLKQADAANAALQEQVDALKEQLEKAAGLTEEIERLKQQNEELMNRLEAAKSKK